MKRKIVIFDMDGVIFDSVAFAAQHVRSQYPDMTEEMHQELLSGNFHEELAKLTIPKLQLTDEERATRKLEYSKNKLTMPLYGGIKELLIDLHNQGYLLMLNTSAYERNCIPLLERENLTRLFTLVAAAELSKSKVEKFNIIKEQYGVTADEMIFVTDTLGDLREAERAGVPTVAVTWGGHNETFFTREPHTNLIKIVNSMSELKETIEQ
jgi:phosphoglycolate phosphatase